METATRRSRRVKPKLKVVFQPTDLPICKLLTPYTRVRDPWSYTYLPSNYFAPLLNRGEVHVPDRLPQLWAGNYLIRPDQPRNNSQYAIWQLGKEGADEVRKDGFKFEVEPRALVHELGACLVAASIELGARIHQLPIRNLPMPEIEKRPDWPLFSLAGREVLLEFDTGSESQEVIERKWECYLEAIDNKLFRRPLILFVTTKKLRVANLIETLKKTIDRNRYPYKYAEHFAFGFMEYDRFITQMPKPTDWAVAYQYQRAGYEPFSFTERR